MKEKNYTKCLNEQRDETLSKAAQLKTLCVVVVVTSGKLSKKRKKASWRVRKRREGAIVTNENGWNGRMTMGLLWSPDSPEPSPEKCIANHVKEFMTPTEPLQPPGVNNSRGIFEAHSIV